MDKLINLVRNIHGGVDATVILDNGESYPTTLETDQLESAEAGELGEIAPLPESKVALKFTNTQLLVIEENLAYLASTDHYSAREYEQKFLGLDVREGLKGVYQKRQDARDAINEAKAAIEGLGA